MPKISQIPGFIFPKPIDVSVEQETASSPPYWIARIAALDLWADGTTEEEALTELRSSLESLVADVYDAPLATLGPSPQRWQALLRQIAIKNPDPS